MNYCVSNNNMKDFTIETFNPAPEEIIIFKFNAGLDFEYATKMFDNVKNMFPNHIVVAMPDDISIEAFTKETLIKELQSTIELLEES